MGNETNAKEKTMKNEYRAPYCVDRHGIAIDGVWASYGEYINWTMEVDGFEPIRFQDGR